MDHQSPYFMHQIKQEPLDFNPGAVYDLPGPPNDQIPPAKPKKTRKRKPKAESAGNGDHGGQPPAKVKVKQEKMTDGMPVKKKRDRFNGMPEEEVIARGLPDHLAPNLDIVIVGINPGLMAAYVGHHYAGPGNHFWKCLYLSGLIPEPMTAYDDYKLIKCGIGFTNIVARTTKGSADLTRKEIKEGGEILIEKLREVKPKIAVFNGKGIYEVFCGHKNFYIGKQPEPLPGTDTVVYVMPSSSARCSQLPRAVDKVPFYAALKKLRDYIRGDSETLDESEVCFPDLELKVKVKQEKQENASDDKKAKKNNQSVPQENFNSMPMVKQEPGFNPGCYGMMPPHNAHSMGPQMGLPQNSWNPPSQQMHYGQQGQINQTQGKDGQSCTELMPMHTIKQEPNFCHQAVCSVMNSEGSFPNVTSPMLYQMANMASSYPYGYDQNHAFSQPQGNLTNSYPSSSQSCHPNSFPTFGQSVADGHYPGMPAAPAAVPAGSLQTNQGYSQSDMGQGFVNMVNHNQNFIPPQGSPQPGPPNKMYHTTPPPQQASPQGHSPSGGRSPGPGTFRPPSAESQQFGGNNAYNSSNGANPNGPNCVTSGEAVNKSPRSQSPRYIGTPPPQNYRSDTPNSGNNTGTMTFQTL